jgi:hypothetical protein
MNTGKNEKVELSENQQNPGLARPEDFKVNPPDANESYPFHGQRGDSKRECAALLRVREENHPKDSSPYDTRPVAKPQPGTSWVEKEAEPA